MTARVVVLTGSEMRHLAFCKILESDDRYKVTDCFREGMGPLTNQIPRDEVGTLRELHAAARKQSEEDFFLLLLEHTPFHAEVRSIPTGSINDVENVDLIRRAAPDLLVSYGCSLIRRELLDAFAGRFLNVHLGLSPYYRGSGTNYWPLVHGRPEFVGTTFMHIDAGIDTGEIIHQTTARIARGDTPHSIGNRLIADSARVCCELVARFNELESMPQLDTPADATLCRRAHYSEESVATLYANFAGGMIESFLSSERERRSRVPIVQQPFMISVAP